MNRVKEYRVRSRLPLASLACLGACGMLLCVGIGRYIWILRQEHYILRELGITERHYNPSHAAPLAREPLVVKGGTFPAWLTPFIPEVLGDSLQRPEVLELFANDDFSFDLARIHELGALKRLTLRTQSVDNNCCERLGVMTTLEELDLTANPIGDEGVLHLSRLTRLRRLFLADTDVTDEGVMMLCRLPELEWLTLSRTKTTDRSMSELAKMSSLKYLSVLGCQISDNGLTALNSSSSLEQINIKDTHVQIGAIVDLHHRNPRITVDY